MGFGACQSLISFCCTSLGVYRMRGRKKKVRFILEEGYHQLVFSVNISFSRYGMGEEQVN